MNTHRRLVNKITKKVNQGYVLDASRMKGTRIQQLDGEWDSIEGDWLPCLIKDENEEVGVDFFEKEDPIPLKEQVGLQGSYPILLEDITEECLQDISQAMVIP